LWALQFLSRKGTNFDYLDQSFDLAGTTYYYDSVTTSATPGMLDVTYYYIDGTNVYLTETIGGYIPDTQYYIIIFEYSASPDNKLMLWLYDLESDVYVFGINRTVLNQYALPVVAIKRNSNVIGQLDPNAYPDDAVELLSAKSTLKTVGVEFDAIVEAIAANPEPGEENGQLVVHSAFLFAVSAYTDSLAGKEYLHHFLDFLIVHQANILNEGYARIETAAGPSPRGKDDTSDSARIAYIVEEKEIGFTYILDFISIAKTTEVGVIGAVGSYTNSVGTFLEEGARNSAATYKTLVLQYQVDATNYEEYVLMDPAHEIEIATGGRTHRSKGGLVSGTLASSNSTFCIPLQIDLINQMAKKVSVEYLAYESARIVITVEEKIRLSWYETSTFATVLKIIIVIIQIVLAFFSGGTSLSASEVFAELIKQVLINVAISVVLKAALATTDNKIIRALLIAAAVYVSFKAGGKSSTADQLLSAVQAVTDVYMDWESQAIQEDWETFTQSREEKDEILRTANEFLGGEYDLDYLLFNTRRVSNFYEDPNGFYGRTLNTNPGILSFAYIAEYVSTQLSLPELQPIQEDIGKNYV